MDFFKTKKIKLSLIEDYIKIIIASNLYNNPIESLASNSEISNLFQNIKLLSSYLKIEYDKVFEKLKLNDISLTILKKELCLNNSLYNSFLISTPENIIIKLIQIESVLKNILINLKEKTKYLKCL